ncbi:TPA: hypothetical protein ACRMRP_006384, partial [Pseudomonas aeruginosa]
MVHGVEKHHEIKRTRIFRDTRPFFEQILEDFSSFHAIVIVYVILVFPLFFLPALFELSLVLGLIYSFIPLSRKPDI